jgi:hypothetical protein
VRLGLRGRDDDVADVLGRRARAGRRRSRREPHDAHCDPSSLAALWGRCGLEEVETSEHHAEASYDDFDDLWAPFLAGVGPGGAYCVSLDPPRRDALRERYRERLGLPRGPFTLSARAWFVRGRVL